MVLDSIMHLIEKRKTSSNTRYFAFGEGLMGLNLFALALVWCFGDYELNASFLSRFIPISIILLFISGLRGFKTQGFLVKLKVFSSVIALGCILYLVIN